jgi:hypothetical protein
VSFDRRYAIAVMVIIGCTMVGGGCTQVVDPTQHYGYGFGFGLGMLAVAGLLVYEYIDKRDR